ncbi:glycosyl hydrolase family 5 [Acetobacteraceae bacterium H6797]|nr:glycosyl hydrolase family 5 [Acetobacteraceae bacterium H6797]
MTMPAGRRAFALGLASALLGPRAAPASGALLGARAASAPGASAEDIADWRHFLARFLTPEGRIVDTGNGGISHSEGQGWAMLCATYFDDRATFDRAWNWTRRHLRRRGDALFAWRWKPGEPMTPADQYNALDGDLFIAAALVRGARVWGDADLAGHGQAIARDILRLCLRPAGRWLMLLPAVSGFEQRDRIIVNPSYYAFPALRLLAEALPDPVWLRLAHDGMAMLRMARFGRWGLPPDWISLTKSDGTAALPKAWRPRFSYDAVRIPLYMAWAGLSEEPAVESAVNFWLDARHRHLPAWVDLISDEISPYPAEAGIQSIRYMVVASRGLIDGSYPRAGWPSPVVLSGDYYSSVLCILSKLAWRDILTERT